MQAAIPIVFGYLPVGLAFGVLARKTGLSPLEAGLMSLLVYAGSSQFIAVEMISKGSMWLPIILTTFFVNLRHFLMSSTIFHLMDRQPFRILLPLSAQLTDESFAVATSNREAVENRPRYLFGLQTTSQGSWIAGSVAGAFFGGLIDPEGYGLPFAFPGLFICLLILQIRSRLHVALMLVAGVLSLLFKELLPGNWTIVATALITSGVGVLVQRTKRQEDGARDPRSHTRWEKHEN
jgi:4-azaleucine resistance transporter AzlC